jgi:cysteine synthase A
MRRLAAATLETVEERRMRHDHVLSLIGGTPTVRLSRLEPPGVEVYAKLEAANPGGSVKDRAALSMIEDARARGVLAEGQTVVEATSGNTGIALALVCARLGHPLVIVMAESFSIERRRLMRFYGARVVLTPAHLRGSGMLTKARELAAEHGWFLPSQFDNEANARAHSRTTAAEIIAAFDDIPLTHWVSGSGTGGTLLGVGRELRRHWPATRVVVCEPDNAPLLQGDPDSASARVRPHPMQGWTPDFVPALARQALAEGLVDRFVAVSGREAIDTARALAQREGILAGISGGATLAGALALARTLPAGSRVLAMLPDTGERYLSTPLFADIEAGMDGDEWALSRSTPGARFDAAAAAQAAAALPTVTPQARRRLAAAIDDPAHPVIMFGLEWCEFCWTLRRFFERIGVALHRIDLDTPALHAEAADWRAALHAHTGQLTIPQVFVAGQWLGGCVDALDAWRDGRLQRQLQALGVAFDAAAVPDPQALLPAWLQPRSSR